VRFAGGDVGDQKRVMTPEQAAVKRQAEQKRQEHLRREREAKKQQALYDRFDMLPLK